MNESVFEVAQTVSLMAEVCMIFVAIASLKYQRLAKFLTLFATIDMVCHSTLRVPVGDEEDQYRLLIMLFHATFFQFGLGTAVITIFVANINYAFLETLLHGAVNGLELHRYSLLIVWCIVQIAGAIAVHTMINAIGSLYSEVHVLKTERCKFAQTLAKNVLVLRQ